MKKSKMKIIMGCIESHKNTTGERCCISDCNLEAEYTLTSRNGHLKRYVCKFHRKPINRTINEMVKSDGTAGRHGEYRRWRKKYKKTHLKEASK